MGNGLGLNFLVRFKTDWIQESNKLIRSRSKGRKIQSIQATKLIPFQLNQLFTTIKDEGRKENLAQKELNNLKSYGICFFIGQRNFNNKIKINRNMFCSLFFLDLKWFFASWLSLHLRLFRSSLCILFISHMNLTINSINNIFPDPENFLKGWSLLLVICTAVPNAWLKLKQTYAHNLVWQSWKLLSLHYLDRC